MLFKPDVTCRSRLHIGITDRYFAIHVVTRHGQELKIRTSLRRLVYPGRFKKNSPTMPSSNNNRARMVVDRPHDNVHFGSFGVASTCMPVRVWGDKAVKINCNPCKVYTRLLPWNHGASRREGSMLMVSCIGSMTRN